MAEVLPPLVADARMVWRKRVLRGGKIVYGEEGEYSLDCLIHDISDSGARISLKPNEFIPTHFFLVDVQTGQIVEIDDREFMLLIEQTVERLGYRLIDFKVEVKAERKGQEELS